MLRLLTGILIASAAHTQPSGEPAVIRTESRLVLVDAVVTDKKGRPIRDLAAGDFRLSEDGQEQKLAGLSLETTARTPDQRRRSFTLLFFDGSSGTPDAMAPFRRDAARFVNAAASPDRWMAVAWFTRSLHVTQNFTAIKDPLIRAIDAVSSIGGSAALPRSSILPFGRGNVDSSDDVYSQTVLFPALRATIESMAAIRGRKSVVLFTSGFPWTPELDRHVSETVAVCNRANVSVYVIDSGSMLRNLAEQTGGRIFGANGDLIQALGRVVDEGEEYYSLAYVPPETAAGSCHAVRVRVVRPGAEVRARSTYCGAPAPAPKPDEGGDSGASADLTPSTQLPFFYRAANRARVFVAMEIPTAAIPFQKSKGRTSAEVSLSGMAYTQEGGVAARFTDMVTWESGKTTYHYENQFDLAPGAYRVRITLHAAERSFAKAERPLAIALWDGRQLAMSSLAIAASTRQVPNLAAALDDAALDDRRPLMAGSLETIPSGSNACVRTAPCQAYLEVYGGGTALSLQVRILDRGAAQPKFDSGSLDLAPYRRAGNSVTPVLLTLPVSGLPPGPYTIELRAQDSSAPEPVVRVADLEVK